ncbi:MAG: hypothetical protein K0S47_3330 [Herbinix sp.]|jgi:hypothetical protein|nr:hypothetical protein [Herbinix sp.]
MHFDVIFSSHHPKATLPDASVSGASGFDKNTKNEPPGGKMSWQRINRCIGLYRLEKC